MRRKTQGHTARSLRGYRLRVAGMAPPAAALSWHTSPGDWIGVLSRRAGCADVVLPSSGDGLGAHWWGRAVGLHLIMDLGPLAQLGE